MLNKRKIQKLPHLFIPKKKNKVIFLSGVEVTDLNVLQQTIKTNEGKLFKYDKLLLATGGTPRIITGQEEYPEQITTFRTIDDFKNLNEKSKKGIKDITIVGGSFLGTELAFALSKNTRSKITQVYLEPEPLARMLPRFLSHEVSNELNKAGVCLKPNSNVVKVTKKK